MQLQRRVLESTCASACVLALLVSCAPAAFAKAELTVSPTILELEAEAGETRTERISVSAGADEGIVVELIHADFGFDDSSYQVTLIRDDAPETTAFSTRDWFSLPKRQYRIPKGRTIQLPLKIEVPENTPGGTYLGAALIRVVPASTTPGSSQIQAAPETGPLLFIAVEGGDPPKAALQQFDVPGVVGSGPIRPKIIVENRGDAFFTYEGTISLSGSGKDETVDVMRQFVVPGQPRRLRISAEKRGDAGRPKIGRTNMDFGRYEVTTRLRIEPTGTTLVSKRTVWVVPAWAWTLLGIAVLVLAGSIALLVRWVIERRRLAPFLAAAAAEDDAPSNDDEDTDVDGPFVR